MKDDFRSAFGIEADLPSLPEASTSLELPRQENYGLRFDINDCIKENEQLFSHRGASLAEVRNEWLDRHCSYQPSDVIFANSGKSF
jgi:hypothetical protein